MVLLVLHKFFIKWSLTKVQGDWKISGLGLTIPLLGPGGSPTRWEFPTFEGRAPAYVQRSFDYMGKNPPSKTLISCLNVL
jgi:hypothetical protein